MAVVTQIQIRRGTAAQWTSANPTLASGEWGYETDTNKAKIGNGSTAWNSLSYIITGAVGTVTSVTAGTGLSGGTITGSGTIAIDSTVATLTGTQTLTNKTLTSPVIATITNSGTLTLPTTTGTLALTSDITVTPTSTNTLTNKTLTSPVISSISNTGTLTLPTSTDTLVGRATTDTLTNKTLTDAKINLGIDAETASYTAVLANNSQIVTMNNASANIFSIPTDASVAFPDGTQITVLQIGAGQTTIQAVTAGTTTVNSTGGTANAPKLRVRYSSATCIKLSANNWVVLGDIS